MQIENVKSSINIDEDIDFQKKGWMVQRILTAVIFLLLIATALGLFGNGIISSKTESRNGVEFRYQKFLRHEGADKMEFYLSNRDTIVTLSFPIEYIRNIKIEDTHPQPFSTEIRNGESIYKFRVLNEARIMLFINPCSFGSVSGKVKLNDTEFSINHFIYP